MLTQTTTELEPLQADKPIYEIRTPFCSKNVVMSMLLCALFAASGPFLIVINYTLVKNYLPCPILLSFVGQFSTWLMILCMHKVEQVTIRSVRKFELKHLAIVGSCSASTLALGNMMYKYASISLAQMLKCFTPIILVTLLHITGVEPLKLPVVLSVLMITFGGVLSAGSVESNFYGIVISMLSSLFEGSSTSCITISSQTIQLHIVGRLLLHYGIFGYIHGCSHDIIRK